MSYRFSRQDGFDVVAGNGLEIAVSRIGAELIGMTWFRPGADPVAVLWRNKLVDPPCDGWWRRHAPILFPIVGGIHDNRSVTSEGVAVHFEGLHGFLRNRSLETIEAEQVDDGFGLSYRLVSDDKTLEMFPWDFEVMVRYLISGTTVTQELTVRNTGTRPMPFQIGWHPGINVPLGSGEKKDCLLRLPRGRMVRMLNDANCHLTGETWPFDSAGVFEFNERELELTYMFDVSGVPPGDRLVEIEDPSAAARVTVSFPDYPHLGVWSDAGAPFICVEPWQGMDDSVVQEQFDRKFGVVILMPGCAQTRRAAISVQGTEV